jgi:hypothetical protein
MSDSKKTVIPDGFTPVKDHLPAVKAHGSVASSSKHLILILEGGKQTAGIYQRWDRDMNAHHIQAKKGEGYFYALDGSILSGVIAYQLI